MRGEVAVRRVRWVRELMRGKEGAGASMAESRARGEKSVGMRRR